MPLTNDFLRNLQCIHQLLWNHESSPNSLIIIARDLPQLLSNDGLDRLNAKWYIYENEIIQDEWDQQKGTRSESHEVNKYHPIDRYWKYVFAMKDSSGDIEFFVLSRLVKSLLLLSHGKADVERDISEDAVLVSNNRSSLRGIARKPRPTLRH